MTYTVNDDNQYTIMRDVSLTYDPAGNLLTNGSWTYSWDNENRLIQVVSTSKLIKFSYDTQGRRIEKKVWNNTTGTGTPTTYLKYIYDGWNLIAELNAKNSNAVVRTYSWGPEAQGVPGTLRMIADSNGVYFPAYDPNGNVMGLVKASDGTVCAQYEYLPYGEQVTATGTMASSNPIRFSTKYYDTEARLYYYGYRYYSPDMGRWLSRDPIEEQGGLNLYAFVNNDPVNHYDMLGLDFSIWIGKPGYNWDAPQKSEQYPKGFSLCRRDIQKDGNCISDAFTTLANFCGGLHTYIQYVDENGGKWGYGFGNIGVYEEKHFNPDYCIRCKKVALPLKYGEASGTIGIHASDDKIKDCIRNNPARKKYNWYSIRNHYNCKDWAVEAVRNCGLNCI